MVLDGYLDSDLEHRIPCHFEDNRLTLFFESFELSREKANPVMNTRDSHLVRVWKRGMFAGGCYLMHLSRPFSIYDRFPFPHTSNYEVDWYIDDYDSRLTFTELSFNFDELYYFIPAVVEMSADDSAYHFPKGEKDISKFTFSLDGKRVLFKLLTYTRGTIGINSGLQRVSELSLSFKGTKDPGFLYKLYLIIEDIFSFVCNRRNLTLCSAKVEGYLGKTNSKENIASSSFFALEKYKDPVEESKIISTTINYQYLKTHFAGLVRLIASNYDSRTDGKVSVHGIHPSTFRRNLIDLRQAMNITSAFEFHVRKLMPGIVSAGTKDTYDEIKALINDKYIPSVTGKKKKIANDIIRHLEPSVSLEDKIKKAITGYDGWKTFEDVVNRIFPDWDNLAHIANEWRNEVAHEKREAIPSSKTISAIRLVELLNYCIILRTSGFSNKKIMEIVPLILDINVSPKQLPRTRK